MIRKKCLQVPTDNKKPLNWSTDNTMAKTKGTNNDLQNSAHKTKDRATRTTLKRAVN